MAMKPPSTPSLDSYMKNIANITSVNTSSVNPPAAPAAAVVASQPSNGSINPHAALQLINQEQQKLKQLFQKKSEVEHQMRLIDNTISKIQGGLEIMQQLVSMK